ncbi:hypothetical protein BN2476_70088 [Paraburkholderia piptadeniae]|uniref:Uncharacterized protein n=1 Tax=Paraburkholderia piptadeniae TaxID=1701573 RepID=A0A1N7RLF3_9BURK|nr:hypothetical protein BN2476_70088 [Paraburkholderia piptadeniae]
MMQASVSNDAQRRASSCTSVVVLTHNRGSRLFIGGGEELVALEFRPPPVDDPLFFGADSRDAAHA